MKFNPVVQVLLLVITDNFVAGDSSEESFVYDTCCENGERAGTSVSAADACAAVQPPDDIDEEDLDECKKALKNCCLKQYQQKRECTAGLAYAPAKRCTVPKSSIGKSCCDECSFGRLSGESQGKEACGDPPATEEVSPTTALRNQAFYKCCIEAAEKSETTTVPPTTTPQPTTTTKPTTTKLTTTKPTTTKPTTTKPTTTKPTTTQRTTTKPTTTAPSTTTEKKKVREKCGPTSCEQNCNDDDGRISCSCRDGFRLKRDKKSCKDINECAEATDDLCTKEGTVCHNTPGSYRCVPLRKRDVGHTCPPGFRRNVENQVCDDINECQLPRPPCPKYLCENTVGGFKCSGKPGIPALDPAEDASTEATQVSTPPVRNDICPPGFRAGPDDECIDIDECSERVDDCQRLSQHCINTHGGFFCQDHVSKRCAPGFKVNRATGICEDIDECEESTEVCKRSEVCVNLPGAYNCKSKISTLPKLTTKTCQEGTRLKPGGSICEDIDECREGTHLCDHFQNCINTFGGHECRCKSGFELDSSSGSCKDVDECALKLDNCAPGLHCLNVPGSFTCTRIPHTSSTSTSVPPIYEYEYYDSEEENTTNEVELPNTPPSTRVTTLSTTPRPPTRSPRPSARPIPARRPTRPPIIPAPRPTPPPTTATARPTTTPTTSTSRSRPSYHSQDIPTASTPYTNKPVDTSRQYTPASVTTSRTVTFTPRRPYYNTPTARRPELVEVGPPSEKPHTIEKDRNPDGSIGLNTSEIPKDRWTNVVEKERPDNSFDPNDLHCLDGYEKNEAGVCVDIDECTHGRHICSSLEVCQNRPGGYTCDCMSGFRRDATGVCAVIPYATPRYPNRLPSTPGTTSTRTTSTSTTSTSTTPRTPQPNPPPPSNEWPYAPRPFRPYVPPLICELGYTFSTTLGKCVDIDECATSKATCSPTEDCVNYEGGYRCVCGARCHPVPEPDRPSYVPSREPGDSNIITVGATYGQYGPKKRWPSYTRLSSSGAVVASCPWGYKLTIEKTCEDVDECSRNVSACGPQQQCENFYGGYSCQCPSGHQLVGHDECHDIDECAHGNPCAYNSKCVNTVGSYRCECSEGFRHAPASALACVDVDECAENTAGCAQGCSNTWGGYHCYCSRGYRLSSNNKTCDDIDECAEWSTVRLRGRLCGGDCVNEPGSYRCTCPNGYRLSEDNRNCIDIDECETGIASCARAGEGEVCQNTRGSYHCHRITCPPGYRLEAQHRCSRIQRSCLVSDTECLRLPSAYSYNFITFASNIYLPRGSVDLFTMHGPAWSDSQVDFDLQLTEVHATHGVKPAELNCFDVRPHDNMCVVSLVCSLEGPQTAQLELGMSLRRRGLFAGRAVARLVVIVSQYEF